MSIATSIEEVTTADATPTTAPFKVSAQTSKNSLSFKWKTTAAGVIRAWRIRLSPLNRNSGKLIDKRGMVCGSGDRCGEPKARSLAKASPLELTTTVAESLVASEADGEYAIQVWAMSVEDGWSS